MDGGKVMDAMVYFALLSLSQYIADIVALATGFVMLTYFVISFYKLFNDFL